MRRRKRRCIQMDAGQNILAGAELNCRRRGEGERGEQDREMVLKR